VFVERSTRRSVGLTASLKRDRNTGRIHNIINDSRTATQTAPGATGLDEAAAFDHQFGYVS
jgi:hypothetical protein